jgi:hypothetical protein
VLFNTVSRGRYKPDSQLTVFGAPAATDGDVAYAGAVDISGVPALLADLHPLPRFMNRSQLPVVLDSNRMMETMLWASNGDVNSGK